MIRKSCDLIEDMLGEREEYFGTNIHGGRFIKVSFFRDFKKAMLGE